MMIYIQTIAIGLALFVFLRSVYSLFINLVKKKQVRIIFIRIFPVIEFLLWITYLFWVFYQLFRNHEVYPFLTGSLLIVIIAVIGWYLIRDFIAGIILKAENAFETSQSIRTSMVSGTIRKLGYRSMEILTPENELVKLPYSFLSSQNIHQPLENPQIVEHYIKLNISSKYQAEKIQNMLERRILEIPWVLPGEHIKVSIKYDENNMYIALIRIHSLSQELALKTEENLKAFVKEVFAE